MKEYLRNSLATVLQLSDGSLDMNEPITNFGLDSLMTVELRNRIEADLGIVVPMAQFLEGPSISQLSAQILGRA
ncbi:MAG: acyl carrier protein [Terriglobia bacterium]